MTSAHARLADLLQRSSSAVALTGAGISVPSGIPDFRSPGGLWETVDPQKVASKRGFILDPKGFWEFYTATWATLHTDYQPNDAHRILADWERCGLLEGVITQNIDGLHEAAGSTTHAVHGTTRRARCRVCDRIYNWEDADALELDSDGHRACSDCAQPVGPDIVLFEEMLPAATWDAARALVHACDLLIVVGTSMEVEPVASLPKRLVHHPSKHLAIVNLGATQWDTRASVRLGGSADEELAAVDALIEH